MTGIVIYGIPVANMRVSRLLCEAVLKSEVEITETGCVLMQSAMADCAKNRIMAVLTTMLE